MAQMYF